MRVIQVDKDDIDLGYDMLPGGDAKVTGTDIDTAERVTFIVPSAEVEGQLQAIITLGSTHVIIVEGQVIGIASPGDWDSPGTSEE